MSSERLVQIAWNESEARWVVWERSKRGSLPLPYGFGIDISWARRVIVDGEGQRRALTVRVDIWRIWEHQGVRIPLPPDAQVLGYWLDISRACYCIMVTSIWAPAWAPGAHAWEVRPVLGEGGEVVQWEGALEEWWAGWFEKEGKEERK